MSRAGAKRPFDSAMLVPELSCSGTLSEVAICDSFAANQGLLAYYTWTNNASAHSAALGPAPPSLVRGRRQAKSKNHWVVANLVDLMETWTRHIPQVLTNVTRIWQPMPALRQTSVNY